MSDTLKFHEMFTDKFYVSSTIIAHRIETCAITISFIDLSVYLASIILSEVVRTLEVLISVPNWPPQLSNSSTNLLVHVKDRRRISKQFLSTFKPRAPLRFFRFHNQELYSITSRMFDNILEFLLLLF